MGSKETYHYLYHHPADSTRETATAEREHELGDDSPIQGARIRKTQRERRTILT